MKILLVARKCILELLREPLLLGLVVSIPFFFIVVTAAGYRSVPLVDSYTVWVYPPQAGAGEAVSNLRAALYPDGRPVFTIEVVEDLHAAREALKHTPTVVLLDFSGEMPLLYGDAVNMNFTRAGLALEAELGRATGTRGLTVTEEASSRYSPSNEFDAYSPGMLVFAMLFVVPQTALILGRELRWGTLRRLQLTSLTTAELLGGVSLAQLILAAVQIGILFLALQVLGFHNRGSLLLALGISLLITFSAIGVGCLVAGISKKDSDAINTGSVFTMLQVFLSGAFFPMPSPEIFRIAGHSIGLFDFIPASHGLLALQQVMNYGASWNQVSFRIGATFLFSLLYFGLGVLVFARLHKPA